MTRPNGISTNYSYDTLSRLLSVLHQAGASTIDGATYTVDAAGNRTSKADRRAGVTSNYTYDALYELTQVVQGANTTESYSYDAVGNRLNSVGVLCVGLTCILLACSGGWGESFYPSLVDAEKDGAITRGWIPSYLPKNSRNIHEVHRIEHPRTWCAFEFLPSDSEGLRKNLKGVNALPPSVTRVPNPGVSWWPAVLKGTLDVEKIHKAGFELDTVVTPNVIPDRTEVLLFAIDWSRGRGFFYQTYYGARE